MAMYCWSCGYETPFGVFGPVFCPNCQVIRTQVETTRAVERLQSSLAAYPLTGIGVSDITFLAEDLAAVGYDLEAAIDYHINRVVDHLLQVQGVLEEILTEERRQTYYLTELLRAIQAPLRTKVSEQIQVAQHQADVGFQAEALQRLEEAEREFPIDPRIYFLRATIFQRQNRPNEAIGEIEKGVKMIIPEHPGDTHSPEHDYVLRTRALLWAAEMAYRSSNPRRAVEFFRKLERYEPSIGEKMRFAAYLAAAGNSAQAISELSALILPAQLKLLDTWLTAIETHRLSERFLRHEKLSRSLATLFGLFSSMQKQEALIQNQETRILLHEWYVKAQRTIPWAEYLLDRLGPRTTMPSFIAPYEAVTTHFLKSEGQMELKMLIARVESGELYIRDEQDKQLKILTFLARNPGRDIDAKEMAQATGVSICEIVWLFEKPLLIGKSELAKQIKRQVERGQPPGRIPKMKWVPVPRLARREVNEVKQDNEWEFKTQIASKYTDPQIVTPEQYCGQQYGAIFHSMGVKQFPVFPVFIGYCSILQGMVNRIRQIREINTTPNLWWDALHAVFTEVAKDCETLFGEP